MRIALLDSVPLTYGGGYENFLVDLARVGVDRGHDIEIVTPTWRTARLLGSVLNLELRRKEDSSNMRSRVVGEWRERGPLSARSDVREADVVYVKNEPHELAYTLAIAKGRTPVVAGFHSAMWGRSGMGGRARAAVYRSSRYAALLGRLAGAHVMQDEQRQFLLQRRFAPDRVHFIPNGVDIKRFEPAPSAARERCRILFVGRLDPQKGVDTLLAAAQLLDREPEWSLTIAGDGRSRDEVARAAARMPGVKVIGYASDPPSLYREHDLVVAPSRWEVFALVPAEALASGLPVAITTIPGNHQYLRCEAVSGVPAEDPASLAKAVHRLLRMRSSDPSHFEALRRKARAFAITELNQQRCLERLVECLEALADQS
jgi:glycosyltransferase involved in cell wall biosynthesis